VERASWEWWEPGKLLRLNRTCKMFQSKLRSW